MISRSWTFENSSGSEFEGEVATNPTGSLLVFDFDGTLSRIVPCAADARLVQESADALSQLDRAGVHIALVSGRAVETLLILSDAENQPGLANATVFGHYGAERLDVATGHYSAPPPTAAVAAAKHELARVVEQFPGATFEDKGLSVAAHFRNSVNPDKDRADSEPQIRAIAERHGLILEPGRLVWELRGPTVNKGDALKTLVDERHPSSVMFAGDDLGDITAFEALQQIHSSVNAPATCAVVSASPEAPELKRYADILCDGPDGVANWLTHLATVVGAGPAL
ncbi:trehalose-phosphatase [Actinomycetaceae bacterium MB13-C1-2]|nr:trehalose-phosphatase [Actinomycetaceae bacterium MB13-C1-2]